MSHEITLANGRREMAYVGATPWHGLGQQLEAGQSIETWQTAAGMAWKIWRSKIRYAISADTADLPAQWRTIDDRHVLLRSDTGNHLGIVSDDYKIVQPGAVLEFFRDLCADSGFSLETAGTLFGGRKFWALAHIGADATIRDGKDKVGGYLLLSTSADGSMATEARFTTVRVVCANTLGFARGTKAQVKVTHRTKFDAHSTKATLGVGPEINDRFSETIEEFRRLAASPVDRMQVVTATGELFKPGFATMDKKEQREVLESAPVARVGRLALNGTARGGQLDGANGTAWGWLNAVTQYVDHEARARSQDNRLNSAWFGRGDTLKERAQQIAVMMADGSTAYVDAPAPAATPDNDGTLASLLGRPVTSR